MQRNSAINEGGWSRQAGIWCPHCGFSADMGVVHRVSFCPSCQIVSGVRREMVEAGRDRSPAAPRLGFA